MSLGRKEGIRPNARAGTDLEQFTYPNQQASGTHSIGAERREDMAMGACEGSLQVASIY